MGRPNQEKHKPARPIVFAGGLANESRPGHPKFKNTAAGKLYPDLVEGAKQREARDRNDHEFHARYKKGKEKKQERLEKMYPNLYKKKPQAGKSGIKASRLAAGDISVSDEHKKKVSSDNSSNDVPGSTPFITSDGQEAAPDPPKPPADAEGQAPDSSRGIVWMLKLCR
mmetsp:Transcript_14689/g.41329  ORF Transcript_14689/g.41329 Transcript_14689/m.41329 type:complete len:169 (-) Transcript_14689:207-713(-)|eukprot:CAMPEP_0117670558 /NCGR_PEP_ID=MMETSP0804-20121206/12831_1 /TAXON_ID=1074897 /ORGANISM="Tetraselmis astigmatica, Strain CCMP880" /LENGTH=168 /DNA_ID=CAMNT_0005478893 /DNA_START=160 /DNA_END=666 /DNA_ORIENTATION=-